MDSKIVKVLSAALSFVLSGILVFNMSICHVLADDVEVEFSSVENVYIGDDNHFYCTFDDIEYRSKDIVYNDIDLSINITSGSRIPGNTYNLYRSYYNGSLFYDIRTCVLFDTNNKCFCVVKILVPSNDFISSVIFSGSWVSIFRDVTSSNKLFAVSSFCEVPFGLSSSYSGGSYDVYAFSASGYPEAGRSDSQFGYRYRSNILISLTDPNLVPIWFHGGDFWDYYQSSESDKLTNLPMGCFMYNYIFWDPSNSYYTYLTSSVPLSSLFDNKFLFSVSASYKIFYSSSGSHWIFNSSFGYSSSVSMDFNYISTDHDLKLVYTNDSFNVVKDVSVFPDRLTELDLAFRPLAHAATNHVYYDYNFAKEAFSDFYAASYMGRSSGNIYTVYFDAKSYTFPGSLNTSKTQLPNYLYMSYGMRSVNFSATAQYVIGFSLSTEFSSETLHEECVLMDFYECWGNKYYFGYLTDNLSIINKSIISQYDSLRALYDRLEYTNYLITDSKVNLNPIIDGINSLGSKLDQLVDSSVSGGSSVDLSGVDSTLNSINTKLGSILGFLVVDEIVDDFFDDIQDIIPDPDEASLSGLVSFLTSGSALLMSGGLLTGIFSNIDTDGMSEASQYITLFWGYFGPFKPLILVPVAFSVAHLVIRKEGIG